MKEKRLLNELGNVNDEFIEQAKPKAKSNRKKLYTAIGAVAATAAVFVVALGVGNVVLKNVGTNGTEITSSSAIANESTNDTALEYRNIDIYYLNGSNTEKESKYLACDPEVIFAEWKKLNSIGDDVRFIKCFINSNGKEVINESTVGYIIGDKATLELTISGDIKKYYDKYGEEALLSSLERTFTEYSDFCTDYKLIIE
ncbi:MAG: hypothetical protein ACI4JV_01780 [Ruminiclostridium sp.]